MTGTFRLFGLLILLIPGCALAGSIKVVASFSVLGDMVHQIAGDLAEVTVLVPPDGDAHTFDPSPADAEKLAGAALVVSNGLGLDGWLDRLAKSAGYGGPRVVASEKITSRQMTEGGRAVIDPHGWQDLRNGILYVRTIEAALEAADPGNTIAYAKRASSYVQDLAALDTEVRAAIEKVPRAKRRVISSHDAFGYFSGAYGVTFLAPQGLSTDSEPSAGDVARLVDQIRQEHIGALFLENMADHRLIDVIASETGVVTGGTLYADALSPPSGPAPTYAGMFRNNVPKLVAGMLKN